MDVSSGICAGCEYFLLLEFLLRFVALLMEEKNLLARNHFSIPLRAEM